MGKRSPTMLWHPLLAVALRQPGSMQRAEPIMPDYGGAALANLPVQTERDQFS